MPTLLICLSALLIGAPSSPVKWKFQAHRQDDGLVRIDIRTQVETGWHIYATTLPSEEGPIATSIRFKPSDDFSIAGALAEPKPIEEFDPNFGMVVRYHDGSPAFVQLIKQLKPGAIEVSGEVEYMVCNDKTCLPPVVVPFTLKVETM
jgi:DsbC/DsbD-like thiol-disulfide interchange protein